MKRVLSLVLAVVMVLGLTTVAFAASDSNAKNYSIGDSNSWGVSKEVDYDGLTIADDAHTIDVKIWYKDAKGNVFSPKKVNKLDLGVVLKKSSGAAAIDKASIKYKDDGSYIRLTLVENLVSTKSIDFEATVYLTSDGKRVRDSGDNLEYVFVSSLENDVQTVYSDDDKLWIEDGNVFEADESNSKLELVMNDDVSLITRMFSGKKYYANINEDADDAAIAIMDQYKDISNYMEFQTMGRSSSTVKFNYSDNLYAYIVNEEGTLVYAGRTNETLPYSNRFYISTKELNLPVEEVEEPTVEEPAPEPAEGEGDDTESAGGGGDDVAPTEANNYNPGTGR